MAMMAAMKKVLSPSSLTRIMVSDAMKPAPPPSQPTLLHPTASALHLAKKGGSLQRDEHPAWRVRRWQLLHRPRSDKSATCQLCSVQGWARPTASAGVPEHRLQPPGTTGKYCVTRGTRGRCNGCCSHLRLCGLKARARRRSSLRRAGHGGAQPDWCGRGRNLQAMLLAHATETQPTGAVGGVGNCAATVCSKMHTRSGPG